MVSVFCQVKYKVKIQTFLLWIITHSSWDIPHGRVYVRYASVATYFMAIVQHFQYPWSQLYASTLPIITLLLLDLFNPSTYQLNSLKVLYPNTFVLEASHQYGNLQAAIAQNLHTEKRKLLHIETNQHTNRCLPDIFLWILYGGHLPISVAKYWQLVDLLSCLFVVVLHPSNI